MIPQKRKRIVSIDVLHGLVMLIMLLDHVRERFYLHMQVLDPMDIETTSKGLFFTRLSAHLCAPIFVFLTGLSAYLYENPTDKPPRSASSFLFKRGLFLIVLEATIINFSWFGAYHALYLQVIWAIGLSMICLSLLIKLPRVWIGVLGFIIVFGHNLLTPITFQPSEVGYTLWTILHDRGYLLESDVINIKISYPVLPWIGVILLGYFSGVLYHTKIKPQKRQQLLLQIAALCLLTLFVIRFFNLYGETLPWQLQQDAVTTLMSFLNYTKYPPSLDFLLLTIGIGCALLVFFEKYNFKWMQVLKTFGSSPMFFYVVHLYVLLMLYQIAVFAFGTTKGAYFGVDNLMSIWMIAIVLAFLLYYPTKLFSEYKRRSTSKWIKYF